MTLNDKKVGFLAIARFPHPIAKDIMTISRIVIVPEFQGFGLATKFMNNISELYKMDRVRITTSLKPFMEALKKNKTWKCVRFGRVSNGSKTGILHNKSKTNTTSHNRITATFEKTNVG